MGERRGSLRLHPLASRLGFLLAAMLLVVAMRVAANGAGQKPPTTTQHAGGTAAVRAAALKPTPKPTPSATPTPPAKTPLSEAHEYAIETQHENDSLIETVTAGLGHFFVALLWPVVALTALVLAARTLRTWMNRAAPGPPPATVAAVTANTQFSLPAADVVHAQDAAADIVSGFKALPPPTVVIDMLAKPLPAGAPQALSDARGEVERYCEQVFRAMLGSQYALLKAAATRTLTDAEVDAIFADAEANGYSATPAVWRNFLVRTALMDITVAGGAASTVYRASDLGRMFLGWFQAQRYDEQTFTVLGRGI